MPIRIAEAHAQFALGNVALALESYRKAVREDPTSTDALLGVAACYDRMGRYDLSRHNYERALALAPGDPQLLGALAASLQLQGAHDEAESVRREIALRLAAAQVTPPTGLAEAAPAELIESPPAVAQTAVQLPVAAAAGALPTFQPQPKRIQAPAPTDIGVEVAEAAPIAMSGPAQVKLQPVAAPEVGSSVTIDLPPPRPVAAPVSPTPVPALPEPEPLQAPAPVAIPVRVAESAPIEESGPRLERLSMGVVALVTNDGPQWNSKVVARSDRSTTVKFVPIREANARPAKVRILNAARVNRLASRTRSWLTNHGWARMPIGDAPAARSQSVVVYPAGQRALAQTLANQFGFPMEESADAKFVTMLLGRDAARIEELRPRRA